MHIKEYLESRHMGIVEFAHRMEISPASVSNYINRLRRPRLDIACRIEKRTKRVITVEDIMAYWEAGKEVNKTEK